MITYYPLIFTALVTAVLTTALGVLVATKSEKWHSDRVIRVLVGIGAGVLLALLATEFLPHTFENGNPLNGVAVILGILLNLFFDVYVTPHLAFLDKWSMGSNLHDDHCHTPHHQHHHHFLNSSSACSAIGCLAACSFFDGVQMYSAFQLSTEAGYAMSLGLLFHMLPDGVIAASMAIASGMSIGAAKMSAVLVGGFLFIGICAAMIIGQISLVSALLLPISTGILMYVTFVHLIPAVGQSKSAQAALVVSASLFAYILNNLLH